MKVELEEIIKDLHYVCFCPECGEEMSCYAHFCEKCKERVAVPIDGSLFVKYFAKKYGAK
jgi:hypothetical protein